MTFTEHNHPNNRNFGLILLSVILTIAVGAIVALSSCKSTEKRQAKLYGKFDKLKRKADADSVLKIVPSKWSLDNFPVTVGKGKTVYIPGKKIPVPVHDTEYVQIDCDSAIKALGVGKGKVRIKPRDSVRVDTIKVTDTIIDNRPLSQLQTDYRALDAKLIQAITKAEIATETKNKQRGKMLWSIGLNLLLIIIIIAYFLRRFGILN